MTGGQVQFHRAIGIDYSGAETANSSLKLSASGTLRGAGVAGVATVGVAGIDVAQQVLAEAQGAVLPLVPQLDGPRWVFVALALAGIGVMAWARIDDWKKGQR